MITVDNNLEIVLAIIFSIVLLVAILRGLGKWGIVHLLSKALKAIKKIFS